MHGVCTETVGLNDYVGSSMCCRIAEVFNFYLKAVMFFVSGILLVLVLSRIPRTFLFSSGIPITRKRTFTTSE